MQFESAGRRIVAANENMNVDLRKHPFFFTYPILHGERYTVIIDSFFFMLVYFCGNRRSLIHSYVRGCACSCFDTLADDDVQAALFYWMFRYQFGFTFKQKCPYFHENRAYIWMSTNMLLHSSFLHLPRLFFWHLSEKELRGEVCGMAKLLNRESFHGTLKLRFGDRFSLVGEKRNVNVNSDERMRRR